MAVVDIYHGIDRDRFKGYHLKDIRRNLGYRTSEMFVIAMEKLLRLYIVKCERGASREKKITNTSHQIKEKYDQILNFIKLLRWRYDFFMGDGMPSGLFQNRIPFFGRNVCIVNENVQRHIRFSPARILCAYQFASYSCVLHYGDILP